MVENKRGFRVGATRRVLIIEALRAALIEFRDRYNHHWILEGLNYWTTAQARRDCPTGLERNTVN